ncbi:MAG: PEGA domain-containing protein [Gammaproteobacteria bacterium]|nr:PEGA domain-containing protein [Gammaproteobacteria bacterium]
MFSGTSDEITFSTNADPVRVYIDGLNVGETPLKVAVEKKVGKGRVVRLEKDGYKTEEFNLRNKFDTVAILDITSVITSGGIDVITGALMEYSPKQYHVEMLKDNQVALVGHSKQIQFASFVLTNAEPIKENLAVGGGEALDALILLVTSGKSSYKFSKWLTDNTQVILSAETSESLLTKLRSSGMTP